MFSPGRPDPDEEISLTPDLIKVLAADTRREILRRLQSRQMTLTELAAALGLQKATLSEHLQKLTDAGLIARRENEGRLWVYYRLTPRGRAIVNPGRTRFFLVLGTAVAAGIVGAVLVLAAQQFAPVVQDLAAKPDGDADGGLGTVLASPDQAVASPGTFDFVALDRRGDPIPADAMRAELVAAQTSWSQVADSESAGAAEPARTADTAQTRGSTVWVQLVPTPSGVAAVLPAGLPPGVYTLVLTDAREPDAPPQTVTVRVELLTVEGPTTWWRGIDPDLELAVALGSQPVEGALELAPAGDPDAAGVSVPVRGGTARVAAAVLDRLAPGDHQLRLRPAGGSAWLPLEARLRVADPIVAVSPPQAIEGYPLDVSVSVVAGRPLNPDELDVRIDGQPVPMHPDASGRPVHELGRARAGTVLVEVGRLDQHAIRVLPDLRPTLATGSGTELNLTVRNATGAGAAGATVRIDSDAVGVTNATGQLRFPVPSQGRHLFVLERDGHRLAWTIVADGANVSVAGPQLTLNSTVVTPGPVVALTLTNPGPAVEPAAIVVHADGTLLLARTVDVAPGGTVPLDVSLEAASPGAHNVTAMVVPQALPSLTVIHDPGAGSQPPPAPPAAGEPSAGVTPAVPASVTVPVVVPEAPVVHDAVALELRFQDGASAGLDQVGEMEETAKTPAAPLLVALVVAGLVAALRRRRF